jgi:hypothetical protein
MTDRFEGRGGGGEALLLVEIRLSTPPPNQTLVILHSLAISVEQLCARGADAPSVESLRPKFCVSCGEPARKTCGVLQLVGHGLYCRQVRGLSERTWIVIWVRRFLCLACGHTISRLPDWLHPWRWYAATVMIEALWRHCILQESSRSIGVRFGRPEDAMTWRSLRRWRFQILISPTLWGWLGPRLGIRKPAAGREQGHQYIERLLAEAGQRIHGGIEWLDELATAVRRTLRDVVHNRKTAGNIRQFPPERPSPSSPGSTRKPFPTQKGSGTDPPG